MVWKHRRAGAAGLLIAGQPGCRGRLARGRLMPANGARPTRASRANETTNETAAESGRLTLANSTADISLDLTRGEPAHHSRPHRIDPVGDNQAIPRDGTTMSDRGGSRRTRAVPPLCAPARSSSATSAAAHMRMICTGRGSGRCRFLAMLGR